MLRYAFDLTMRYRRYRSNRKAVLITRVRRAAASGVILAACAACADLPYAYAQAHSGKGKPPVSAAITGFPDLEISPDQALWAALAFENQDLLSQLITIGADVNKPDELSLMTPLMAVETYEQAIMILNAGANIHATDRLGRTAMHHAVRMRDSGRIIAALASRGADPNAIAPGAPHKTPLCEAVETYLKDIDPAEADTALAALVAAGANINWRNAKGSTLLEKAVMARKAVLVKRLLQLGADVKLKFSNGKSPLQAARETADDAVLAAIHEAIPGRHKSN